MCDIRLSTRTAGIGIPGESPPNRTELSQERGFSRIQARDRPQGTSRAHLVNEVANVREDAVTQFHAPKTGTEWGVQVLFKTLEDVSG